MKAIATLTGRVVDYLNPSAESINSEDLAAGLGSMPRFSGQTIRPYSVAQHSLLVASLVEPKFQLHALLHDAPEAFLGDLPTPAKDAMRALSYMRGHSQSPYDILERAFYKAIARPFGLEEGRQRAPGFVHSVCRSIHAWVLRASRGRGFLTAIVSGQKPGLRTFCSDIEIGHGLN